MHFNKPHWEILTPGRTGSTLIHRLIQNCYFLKNLKRLKFYDFDQINTDILQEIIRYKDVIVHDHHVHFYPYYRNNNFNLVISIRDIEEIIYSRLMFEKLAAYETKIWHYYSTDPVPTIKPFVVDLNEIDTLYGHIKFFCEKINEQIEENDEVCFLDYADFYQNTNSLTEFFGFGKLDFSRIEKKLLERVPVKNNFVPHELFTNLDEVKDKVVELREQIKKEIPEKFIAKRTYDILSK